MMQLLQDTMTRAITYASREDWLRARKNGIGAFLEELQADGVEVAE